MGVGVHMRVSVRATYLPQADNREPMKVVQVLTVLLAAHSSLRYLQRSGIKCTVSA